MNILIDKLIIFILCAAFYITNFSNSQTILPVLIAIIISSAVSYVDNSRIKAGLVIFFAVISFYNPVYLFFIPLILYDVIFCEAKWIWIIAVIALILNLNQTSITEGVFIVAFSSMAILLKFRIHILLKLKEDYYALRDSSAEMSLQLEVQNKELIEKQDNEINLATLNERNRIARDIHDNVGHMLSSSILQVGALLATVNDQNTKDSLKSVNNTLKNAMGNIRESVHNLHEQSIDLHQEIKTLTDNFTFCKAELFYDVQSSPDKKLKSCFILIVKEALANVIKHSNATKVTVSLLEHPGLYQLIVHDNGTKIRDKDTGGIGLSNISDRVAAFKGNLNISSEKGFRIFISIPK